jgi:integrase
MSEKRRDNRNRILREGEYQRTDGRYRYRYIDEDGKEKNVYSWRLDKNDPTPRGKKRELSLREKEKQIQADLFDHIVTRGGNYTVVELVEKYTSLKTGVGHNTKAGYKTVINILNREAFGKQRIDKVRLSDAKAWLIKLQQVDGRGYSSIHSIRGVLRPAFQLAVDDDLIRILANRVAPKIEPMVDGYAGFLFLDKNDKPMVALHWEKYLEHIIEKYNKIYRIQMPKVTPHVCRHTFCSNMAKSGMNPKTLQYIMGHSDISVTLNVYTHVQFDDAQAELLRVAKA